MSLDRLMEPHRRWMDRALEAAEAAYETDEVPVGAVVVRNERVIGRAHNRVEERNDPTAHAEMLALRAARNTLGTRFLSDSTLYVTLEPCPMCAGALVWTRLGRLVFGAFDEKAGAASTLYSIPQDDRLNHQVDVLSGVRADAATRLLQRFFADRRAD